MIARALRLAGLLSIFLVAAGWHPAQSKPVEDAAANAWDQKLIAEAKAGSEIMKNLTYLSDQIGPRLTGSAALKRANEWTAEKMKSYGLTNVKLEPWEIPVAWERGSAAARLVEENGSRPLVVAAMGWTPGTKGKITGDVVILKARNPQELKQYEGKLKGKIVLRGDPNNVRPLTETFGAGREAPKTAEKAANKSDEKSTDSGQPPLRPDQRRTEMMRFRREMADFLSREGVAVMMLDAGKPHGLLDMTGGWRGEDRVNAPDPLPTLFVAHEHYAMLHRMAKNDKTPTRVEVDIDNKLIPGPVPVYNTVGEIRGEKPDEFVVVGAHLDSWDLGQGTTDNGTGTCVVLEAARILNSTGFKPKRTIRFVLFTGEEQGLHGSKAYVKRHDAELPKTTAAIVHDTGTGKIIGLSLMGRDVLKPILESELAALKDLGVTDISTRSMGGSDHQSFEAKGVPGFMFRQDPAEYRLTHHSQSDTLDKAREPDLIQGAQVMAVLAARLANRDDLLPRDKPEPKTKDKTSPKGPE